jgi:hypothetical protein
MWEKWSLYAMGGLILLMVGFIIGYIFADLRAMSPEARREEIANLLVAATVIGVFLLFMASIGVIITQPQWD